MSTPDSPEQRYQRLKSLFADALDLPLSERPALVARLAAEDSGLAAELGELLASHVGAPDYLEGDLLQGTAFQAFGRPQVEDDLAAGQHLGPYRVIERIGRGGMGAVYLAERDDEFHQRVAIKMVRAGTATDDLVHRFRQERQILAALDHPNIARLLDGGSTESGHPYLVMEYIEGTPIDRYCDTHALPVADRLALFRTVCGAVQFAHQKFVIHRDLKPSNVLVTASGVPKLLDFGIAKIVDPGTATAPALATRQEVRLMTPEYASPEQARGAPLSAASDVYALGVLLYQLLTNQRPYEVAGLPLHEVTRVICEHEPTRPSAVVRKSAHGAAEPATRPAEGTTERLSRRLTGDVDTIVLKALAKDPARRYASVEQLSEDVRRHLEGLPVVARPDTFGYRAQKFVRRHRGSVSAAALLALTLIAGVITTTWQAKVAGLERDRAQRRFSEVRQLATAFLFEFHDAVAALPGATPARQLVVKRALQHLAGLATEAQGDVELQLELAQAYLRVGDVQGNPRNANLGDTKAAADSYEKGRHLLDLVIAVQPLNPTALVQRAAVAFKTGDVLQTSGDTTKARAAYEASVALADAARAALGSATSGAKELDRLTYTANLRLGDLLLRTGEPDRAAEQYRIALPLTAAVAEPTPGRDQEFLQAILHERLANIEEAKGNRDAAIEGFGRALALHRALVAREPQNRPAANGVAVMLERRGTIQQWLGRHDAAFDDLSAAIAQAEALHAVDPTEAQTRTSIVRTNLLLSTSAVALGRVDRARAAVRRAFQVGREDAEREGASAESLNAYAYSLLFCEPEDMRRPAEALRYARRAVDLTKGAQPYLVQTLATALFQTGDIDGAIATQEKALALLGPPSAQRQDAENWMAEYQKARKARQR